MDKMDTKAKFWERWRWFNGCRKDHGFGWGMTGDGGEQLSSRPPEKSEIE